MSTEYIPASEDPSFWSWMARTGLRRFWKPWLVVHLVVGLTLSFAVPGRMSSFAGVALMPLASILVGLTFAWSANAASLLQTEEVYLMGADDGGRRYHVFVFTYQGALFLVLAISTVWSLVAAGLIDQWQVGNLMIRHVGRTLLFALSSLTIRECWHACVGVQEMLLNVRRQRMTAKAAAVAAAAVRALPESGQPVSGASEGTAMDQVQRVERR